MTFKNFPIALQFGKAFASTPGESVDATHCSKKFSLTFLLIVTTLLVMTGLLNYVVDPYSQFHTGWLPPALQLTRDLKAQGIEHKLDAQALILGSSRVMKIEPAYLKNIDHLEYYNAGVNFGKPEDFQALIALYRTVHHRSPKKVIIGVDVVAFNDRVMTDQELMSHPKLAPFVELEDGQTPKTSWFGSLLGIQSTKLSLRSLKKYFFQSKSTDEQFFRTDGVIVYQTRESRMQSHTYDFEAALRANAQEYAAMCNGFACLSESRWRCFEHVIQDLLASQCEVFVFITPDHPLLHERLKKTTCYAARTHELDERLELLASTEHYHYINLQNIADFDGEAMLFFDGVHPLEANTRKIVRTILREENEGIHAIQ